MVVDGEGKRERERERGLICMGFVLAGCSWLYSRYLVKGDWDSPGCVLKDQFVVMTRAEKQREN
jgi:hypothetical protein